MDKIEIIKKPLFTPSLDEVAKVLREGLTPKFASLEVDVVDCPSLKDPPYCFSAMGLGGSPRLVDVGGPPYLLPLPQKDKIYDLNKVAAQVGLSEGALLIGAGAGPGHVVGVNCEMMANIRTGSAGENLTRLAKIDSAGKCELLASPSPEFRFLANLFGCEGKPGKVVRVCAEKRLEHGANFVTMMRNVLHAAYGDSKPVGMGGVFLIEKGQARLHVMPDCSATPLETEEDVNNWLRFFIMNSPLVCLTTFISHDPGLDLRVEHTHCYSQHGEGGHYHYDTTPDTIRYSALLMVAESIHRIDPPAQTHCLGRD